MNLSTTRSILSILALLLATTTTMAASIQIVSLEPEKIHAGKKTTVIVRITNDSDSSRRVTLESSVPKGCSLKPLQPDIVSFRGYYTPTVPAKGSFDAKFELLFTEPNLSGGLTWTIKEYGRLYDGLPLGDAKTQTIVPKVGKDQWKQQFTDRLNEKLKTGEDGFREIIEQLHGSLITHYKNGSVVNIEISTDDGSSDIWEDGYNIAQIKARLHFNWGRGGVFEGSTKFTMVYRIDFENSGPVAVTQEPLDLETDAHLPTLQLAKWKEWVTGFVAVSSAIVVTVKAAGAAAAALAAAS